MADKQQFLDFTGLSSYDELIKNLIDNGDEVSIKVVALSSDSTSIEFYTQTPGRGVSPAYSIEFPVADVSDLMSLVSGAVENDIAVFDTDGQVVDSGTLLSALATMDYIGEIPSGYESTTIVGFVQEVAEYINTHGYDDTDLKTRMTAAEEAIETLNGDAETEGSVAYAVEEAKEELTEAIATAVGNAGHLKREIVDVLPDVADADELTIYLIAKETSGEDNVYDEYMVIDGAWEKIGDTEVDLTEYAKTEYVDGVAESTLKDAKDYANGLASNYDAAGTAEALVKALEEGQVATNTSNIASLKSETEESISNIETSITNVETSISSVETDVSNIETNITNIEASIQNIESAVNDIEAIPVEDVEALFD